MSKRSAARDGRKTWTATEPKPGTCRYCGCQGDQCIVPEGQYGFRGCFWIDKRKTVCAAPICTYKWQQDSNSEHNSQLFRTAQQTRGIFTRVAKQLDLNVSHVRRVAIGERQSARISKALAAEIHRVKKADPERSAVSPSRKPRFRFHINHARKSLGRDGSVYAYSREMGLVIKIGCTSVEAAS